MTHFKSITKQIFLQKFRYVKGLWIIQLGIIILLPIFNFFFPSSILVSLGSRTSLLETAYNVALVSTIFVDLIFLGLACYRSERINSCQTYSLIPISNKKLLLSNLLSTILGCAILFIVQLLILSALAFILYHNVEKSFLINQSTSWNDLLTLTIGGLDLIFAVLLIQTFISFINFSSKSITDFLPTRNSKLIRGILIIIITIIGVYFAFTIMRHIDGVLNLLQQKAFNKNTVVLHYVSLYNLAYAFYPLISMILGTVLFGSLDLWLFDKYFEVNISN